MVETKPAGGEMDRPTMPGQNAPEVPRVPRPEPELPERTGAPPGPEVPAQPRPEPESAPRPRRPEAPFDPNAPGE
jgi:hypothetical protein